MLKYFILSIIIAFQLSVVAQSSSTCFNDFNFFGAEGVGIMNNCTGLFYVKCFSKNKQIFKVISSNYVISEYNNESIKVTKIEEGYMYIFKKAKMPLEKKLYRTANDNRFDTLFSKNDTLYFKKAFPNQIRLSKYFRLSNDTICIVSFYYSDLKRKFKKKLIFQNISNWGSDQNYTGYGIVKLIINKVSLRFVSIVASNNNPEDVNQLNKRVTDEKVPPSLFWMCIVFRFMI